MILSKISQMDSASATEYLTSSMKGYHVAVEDVIGIVDKLCTVDLSAAVSADGLANGMSRVAGVAESAGISMDKLLGYLAVIGETTQLNMGSVGNALKTIFLRMQDIKSGKLELIDEDGTVELLSDVEITLKNVGIDLRATVNEFNNSGEVLDSLAEKWDTLSSVQQGALQKAFSGQRQGNMFRVLMENYETAKKYMEIASESAGASEEKFQFYLESLESKTNSLIASLQNLASTTISEELYASILDVSKSIVDTTAETGLLKGTLLGLTTSGSLYAFSQIAIFVRDVAQGFSDLSEAMDMTRSGNVDMQRLIDLTSGLSNSQTRLVLSTEHLDDAQRFLILTNQNLARGMNRDVAEATARATLNNMRLTTSAVSLTGVMRGLWQTLLAHPYMIVATAVSALTMAYHNHNQKLEETKQKNLEASEKAVEHANSLKDLYTEYSRLSAIQERTASQEEEFKTVVDDITKKLGDKAKALEGLTAGTNEYAEALANLTKEELQSASVEATIGRKIAEEDLQKDVWSDLKGSKVTVDSNSKGKSLSDEAQKAVDIVSDSLKEFETINRSWNNLAWDITSDSPEEALEYYNALVQAREALVLASEDNEALLETEVYKDLNSAITTMSDSLEDYISKRYEEEKLNYMAQNGIPQTVEEYNSMKSAMDKVAGTSEGLKSKFNDLLTADFSGLATSIGSVAESGEHLADSISSFNIESFSNTIQSYEDGYKRLIEAQEEWNEAKALSAETFADLQESGLLEYLDFTSEGLTINKEKLLENAQASKDKAVADLHAAMMNDMLQIALGNVDSVSEEAKTVMVELGNNTEEAGQQALSSVGNWATLGAVITDTMARARGEDRGFNGVSDEQKAQMESVYNYYHDMAEKVSAIDITVPNRTQKAKDSAKKTSDEYLKAFEEELKKLETLRDQGKISESEFLESYKSLYGKYFKDIDKYADEFAEHQYKRFERLKDLYDSAISAIVSFKDKEIEALNEAKDKAIENLEAEQKAREDVIDAQKEQLETQVDLIDKQIESREAIVDGIQGEIDLIQDEIDAMESANKKRKEQIDLQQKQQILNKAMNQRTELAFVDNQMIHRPNDESVRNARQDVEDAEFNIAISAKKEQIAQKEKEIALIEKEIELFEQQKDSLNEQIDALDKQAESIEKYYDTLIEQQEKFYNAQIENLEKQKSQWEELAEIKEVADAYSSIEQVFGSLGYTVDDVLNNSAGVFEDFKSKYIDLLNVMNSNDSFGNGLSYAVDELDKTLANVGTNTEGLDNLPAKMEEINSSVVAVSDAFSGEENSLKGSVQNVIDKVAGNTVESKETSKEKDYETDSNSLIGAIQAQYDKTAEVIPQQIETFNLFESAIGGCVNRLNEMISALKEVQTLSANFNVGTVELQPINGYATGITHAKKGLAVLAEDEKPELLKDNKGNLSLVTEPTLVNMEGGEKVYNGEETKNLLKGNNVRRRIEIGANCILNSRLSPT